MRPVTVGIIGAGNVIWAYFQVLDRLLPRGLAQIGSSDAHMISMVGLARTRFPGRSPEDLRQAIESGATTAEGRFATPAEMASECIPQLARSMVHLPLRRVARYARSQRAAISRSHWWPAPLR